MRAAKTPAQLRTTLGMSMETIAELAGVGRDSVRIYEINPAAVGDSTREPIAHVYRELAEAYVRIRKPPKKASTHGAADRDVSGRRARA